MLQSREDDEKHDDKRERQVVVGNGAQSPRILDRSHVEHEVRYLVRPFGPSSNAVLVVQENCHYFAETQGDDGEVVPSQAKGGDAEQDS